MNKFLQHHLKLMVNAMGLMEQGINVLKDNLLVLYGYCDDGFDNQDIHQATSHATYASNYLGNGFQEIVLEPTTDTFVKSIEEIIREVQEMIIELKIKGSVREHRDGLIKFTSTVFGCVYGHTKAV